MCVIRFEIDYGPQGKIKHLEETCTAREEIQWYVLNSQEFFKVLSIMASIC